jgi:hypothetical protein
MAASANKDDVCSKITIRVPTKEDWELYDRVGDDIWEGEAISQVCNHERWKGKKKNPASLICKGFRALYLALWLALQERKLFFCRIFLSSIAGGLY